MKFHYGPPPDDPTFDPSVGGWRRLVEPSPVMINVVSIPACFLLAMAIVLLWGDVNYPPFSPDWFGRALAPLAFLVAGIGGFALMVAAHEIIHGLTYPGFGFSERVRVYLGAWPSRLLFYAVTPDALTRNRLLAVYVAPFIVLSLLPLALHRLFGLSSLPSLVLSVVNALSCGGDAVGMGLLLWQAPAASEVRNKGWETYWRPLPAPSGETVA